jgi:hypothetical protein
MDRNEGKTVWLSYFMKAPTYPVVVKLQIKSLPVTVP